MAGDNKQIDLWPADPFTRIQNLIRSSHGHSTPSLKISCKSDQPFSRNVADKETKKERKKEIARKQYLVPYRGRGKNGENKKAWERWTKSLDHNLLKGRYEV